jgi:hypothetical protein
VHFCQSWRKAKRNKEGRSMTFRESVIPNGNNEASPTRSDETPT